MKNKKFNSTRIIALFFLLPMIITSCRFYHIRSHTVLYDNAKSMANNSKYPYLIIHSGTNYWQLHNPKITDNSLTGKLVSVNERVDYYYKLGLQKSNFQAPIADRFYQKQLHFYVDAFEIDGDLVTIPFEDVTMIKSLDANIGLNTMSNIGIFGGSSIAAMGIFLAIACGCPHNYIYDGEHYYYNNTLFTGATAANLERHDYKSLPDYFPKQTAYKMLVKNEENEIQYTNLLEMIAVNHQKNVEVFTDQKGTIYTVADKREAVEALNDAGESVANEVNYTDDQAYPFQQLGDDDFSHVYAKFNIEGSGANAKIIVRAKNSEWAGTVYHSFASLLGKNYTKWVKHNQKRTPEEANHDVQEAGIPLIVAIKQHGVWVNLEAIDLISEVNFNSLIIPVPQEMITDSQVEIRVTSGYNFWQLDALHMDFSAPQSVSIEHISPTIAKGASDFTNALSTDDANYMVHEVTGDSTIIEFQNIPIASEMRTLFLHSKGYYISKDAYEGATNWQAVMALKQAGGLSFFSKALYESYLNMTKND